MKTKRHTDNLRQILLDTFEFVSPRDIAKLPIDVMLEVDTAIICSQLQDMQCELGGENADFVEKVKKLMAVPTLENIDDDIFHVPMSVSEIISFFSDVSELPPFSFRKHFATQISGSDDKT